MKMNKLEVLKNNIKLKEKIEQERGEKIKQQLLDEVYEAEVRLFLSSMLKKYRKPVWKIW